MSGQGSELAPHRLMIAVSSGSPNYLTVMVNPIASNYITRYKVIMGKTADWQSMKVENARLIKSTNEILFVDVSDRLRSPISCRSQVLRRPPSWPNG